MVQGRLATPQHLRPGEVSKGWGWDGGEDQVHYREWVQLPRASTHPPLLPVLRPQLPLQAAVERELVRRAVSNPDLEWSPALTQFPHPAAKVSFGCGVMLLRRAAGQGLRHRFMAWRHVSRPPRALTPAIAASPLQSPSMIGTIAPTFLFASIMFQVGTVTTSEGQGNVMHAAWPAHGPFHGCNLHAERRTANQSPPCSSSPPTSAAQFVLLLHDVVHEEESGVRRAMATMGLRDSPFWASWFLYEVRTQV